MTEEKYDELIDFIMDTLNGHNPDNLNLDCEEIFNGDFDIIEGSPDWLGTSNSKSIVMHECLENEAYVEQSLLSDPSSYNFQIKQAVKVKDTNYFAVFEGMVLAKMGKHIMGL